MAGYNGFSMSNNAVEAYENGEMPYSKWTKSELLDSLSEDKAEFCKKLTCGELKSLLLERSSWHHTSKFYNAVDFYKINEDCVNGLTKNTVDEIVLQREPKEKKEKVIEPKPTYITAYVEYEQWEGTKKHPIKYSIREIVQFMSNDKMVVCSKSNTWKKRLSSLNFIYKIEQKTKFATDEQLRKKMKGNKKK